MIGDRLKYARFKAKLTQLELGVRAGLDEESAGSRISSYEHEVHTPDFSLVARFAEVLDVPTAYFYAVEDDLAEIILKYHIYKKTKPNSIVVLSPT